MSALVPVPYERAWESDRRQAEGLLDGLINSKIGLPSAAGKNTAVLNGKVEIANSELVEESEG